MSLLNDSIVGSLKVAKVFHHPNGSSEGPVTSLEFDIKGEHCLVGNSVEESMTLYDAVDGVVKKTIFSKKYGVGPVRFTHHANNVIYASGKGEHSLRYLSLHDNAYLRYFRGHEEPITALEMSSIDDTFISGAANDTVRLWDLRSPNCHGVLAINGRPLVSIDPQGVVFAVALDNKFVRLFDMRGYEKGPFACFEIVDAQRPTAQWNSLNFTPCGKEIMVGTTAAAIYTIDSFDGYVKNVFTGNINTTLLDLRPTITPDSRYVICGSQDSKIHIWNRENAQIVASLEGHTAPPNLVKFNPKFSMLASACTNLAFWIPDTNSNNNE